MLIFEEEALQEIRQAQLWYEVQKSGLGERFRLGLFSSLYHLDLHIVFGMASKGPCESSPAVEAGR
jgi:hypothetical protein